MSLISDTDYLIHSLRLSYLRDVEDLYGPRILSLEPSYRANPYILASGHADSERWPELNIPASPPLSEDERQDGRENASGYPGARLKYTQTIMGGKSGGLGIRVHGKRMSTSKRGSYLQRKAEAAGEITNGVQPNPAPAPEALSTSAPPVPASVAKPNAESWVKVDASETKDKPAEPSTSVNVQIHLATAPEEAPVQKVVQFIPKFSKEVEKRRQMRMAARRGPLPPPTKPSKPLSFDTSSEEESASEPESASSEDEDHSDGISEGFGADMAADSSMDEGDEFDPEFAATRMSSGVLVHSDSDVSGNSSMGVPDSAIQPRDYQTRPRLSPVSEQQRGKRRAHSRTRGERPPELNLAPPSADVSHSKKSAQSIAPRKSDALMHTPSVARTPSHTSTPSLGESIFARKQVPSLNSQKPAKSALSSMLAQSSGSSNPFSELYAAISGRGHPTNSMTIVVYFPHSKGPRGRGAKGMELNVRKDASVEEVVGYALWNYWEEEWEPKLEEGLDGDGEEAERGRRQKLSALGWVLRIAEDDGEPDDDFPPPDRMGKIAKFNSDAYAILEGTASQIAQNEVLEAKIQRRPSRIMNSKKPLASAPTLAVPSGVPAVPSTHGTIVSAAPSSYAGSSHGGVLGSVPLSTSLGPSSSHGPQIFLRVRVGDASDDVHVSTTIPVSAGMYMQEALELVCKRRKLPNPKDHALVLRLPNTNIIVPLDRTVASLQGNRELYLYKRAHLASLGLLSKEIRTTDPNASIFKHMSESTPEQQYSSVLDYTAAYKKYTIYRKMPMLVTRQERQLAIDGVYIHVMPSTNKAKAVFDHGGKTASYHIKSIADCQQSQKSSALFKLVLNRASGNKRYDFEAESPKLAAEIVHTIRSLKTALERSGTVNRSRRSRQVG